MFQKYAEVYDLIYRDKDYPGECDFIESLFSRYLEAPVERILDVSAGTGSHAVLLAQRGYDVTAFDYSPAMLALASAKAEKQGVRLQLAGGISMAELPNPTREQDVVLSLFASINYLTETEQIESFFSRAKDHLSPNGLLIFDYWNGIACLRDFSTERTKEAADSSKTVERTSKTRLIPLQNQAEIVFHCKVRSNTGAIDVFQEKHVVRYFFPREIEELLKKSGYRVLKMLPFKELDRDVNERDWYITVVARKA